MRQQRNATILTLWVVMLIPLICSAQQNELGDVISFRTGSDILLDSYKDNGSSLRQIENIITQHKVDITKGEGYILLRSEVESGFEKDPKAINNGAIQASVLRSYIESEQKPQAAINEIYYTLKRSERATVDAAIAKYNGNIPFINSEKAEPLPVKTEIKSTSSPIEINDVSVNQNTIDFRHGSEVLYGAFQNNKEVLNAIRKRVEQHRASLQNGLGHLRLTALITTNERNNLAALNFASIRASVVRQYLKDNYSFLTDSNFTFFISPNRKDNAIEVEYLPIAIAEPKQNEIWYSLAKNHPEKVEYAMSHYQRIPFLDGSELFETPGMDFGIIDPALDQTQTQTQKIDGAIDEKIVVTIYYRWDKDDLDKTYLTNTETLHQIDSLLHFKSADFIDSLRIVAYASPEGPPDYNKRLSLRRANTLKNYLLTTYPRLRTEQIITEARGENWDGFRRMGEADPKLPMKEQVLAIINNPNISDLQRQAQIAKLDGGRIYKNYILPNYYRYLRSGASLFVVYNQGMPVDIDLEPIEVTITEPEPEPVVVVVIEPEPIIIIDTIRSYPIALRTNLLYDAVGAINIGIELPYGRNKNWSLIADFAYAYWRSPKNIYALQTLEYGLENRYWFGVGQAKKDKKTNWTQPLKGFYIGVYGKYWQRYDVQFVDGIQGDATWSAGLTAGYAIPLNRSLSFDFGIGAGWVSTSEYRHYHQPEYDANGKYHLMWQQTGRWSGLSLTKVRFALVWLIQTTKTQERRIMP